MAVIYFCNVLVVHKVLDTCYDGLQQGRLLVAGEKVS